MTLKDRVAVVTGASQGIGRATAELLAECGARVVLAARNAEKLTALEAEIRQKGGQALAVAMDVAKEDQIKAGFARALEHFGHVDILVNNAGIARDQLAVRL
ncbi:MAG: SDR family NAD(P)-dependent oxidoreductase, partial [Dongiaceae bacterium]